METEIEFNIFEGYDHQQVINDVEDFLNNFHCEFISLSELAIQEKYHIDAGFEIPPSTRYKYICTLIFKR